MEQDRARILHFLWSGSIGGMEGAIVPLLRSQVGDGSTVGVFFADPSGQFLERLAATGATVEVVRLKGAADVRRLFALVRVARRYDVHHFHFAEPLLLAASALSGRRLRVYTERGGHYAALTARKRVRHALTRALVQRLVRGFSGNTAHSAGVVAERYALDPERVLVTPNALALDRLEVRTPRADVRRRLGIPADAFVVASAGFLKPWKRVDMVLRAVASQGRGDWWVLVVGDGPERQRLERLADEFGVQAIFTGMQTEIADLLAAADAFAFPSDALESFGNAAVEAMALGVPTVVLADSPGVAAHIEHEVTGFVAADEQELAATLARLASDRALRSAVGEAGSKAVRAVYTPDRMARAYARLYRTARVANHPPLAQAGREERA